MKRCFIVLMPLVTALSSFGTENAIPPGWQIADTEKTVTEQSFPPQNAYSIKESGFKKVHPRLGKETQQIASMMRYFNSISYEEREDFSDQIGIPIDVMIALHQESINILEQAGIQVIKERNHFCNELLNNKFSNEITSVEIQPFKNLLENSIAVEFNVITKGYHKLKQQHSDEFMAISADVQSNISYMELDDSLVSADHWVNYYKNDCGVKLRSKG